MHVGYINADAGSTWMLQYAPVPSADAVGQVLPPSVAIREWPEIPAALQKKYAELQVVISALVDKDGKVSNVAVMRTSDQWESAPTAKRCQMIFRLVPAPSVRKVAARTSTLQSRTSLL